MSVRFAVVRILAAALVATWFPTSALGQAEPAEKPIKTETIKLAITPAKESTPLLKYRLTPRFIDLRPGNAATLYAQAALHYKPTSAQEQRIGDLLKAPRSEFERFLAEKSAGELMPESPLDLLRLAAHREHCDWDLPLREQQVYSILLPEQSELRKLARLVALRARAYAVKKDYPRAIATLTIGYRMAYQDGQTPLLISGLIGVAIARMMDDVVLELAAQPGSPNLYWALTTRPNPLVDFSGALEAESSALDMTLPILNAAVEKDPTAMNWDAGMKDLGEMLDMATAIGEGKESFSGLKQFGIAAMITGTALLKGKEMREYLVSRGVPAERVERMGGTQLVLAYDKLHFDEYRDQMFVWFSLPLPQARAGIEAAERRVNQAMKNKETVMPWAGLLLPAIGSVRWTHAKQERMGDVLRLVEALRLHAAEHEGKLPKSLAEVQTRTPLPLDCVTGEPFQYVVEGDTAKLTLPPNRANTATVVYEITVAK